MSHDDDMIEMKVEGLVFDPLTNTPIIILKDKEGEKSLPIWVGYPEATAIAFQMETVVTPRPMTHDLIKNLLTGINVDVNHICVNDLKDNTFYAIISISTDRGVIEIDSRPSDAIAVALRVEAPIFVTTKVLENAKDFELNVSQEQIDREDQFKKWIDNVKPSDFGNLDQ